MLSVAGENSSINDATNFLGPEIGLFYRRKLSPSFSIQPEVFFAVKGAGYYDYEGRHQDSVALKYLEIPILVNAHFAGGIPEFFAGPSFSFLLNRASLLEMRPWAREVDRLKGYDFCFCVGFRLWLLSTSFEVRYQHSFINILPSSDTYHTGHYHESIAFMMGFRLPGKASSK